MVSICSSYCCCLRLSYWPSIAHLLMLQSNLYKLISLFNLLASFLFDVQDCGLQPWNLRYDLPCMGCLVSQSCTLKWVIFVLPSCIGLSGPNHEWGNCLYSFLLYLVHLLLLVHLLTKIQWGIYRPYHLHVTSVPFHWTTWGPHNKFEGLITLSPYCGHCVQF